MSDLSKPQTDLPGIAQLIGHVVMVCACPAKVVLVAEMFGGSVECPQCKQRWKVVKLNMLKQPDESMPGHDHIHIEAGIEPQNKISVSNPVDLKQRIM